MDFEILSNVAVIAAVVLLAYRLLVAAVFVWLAKRVRGPVSLSSSDLFWVGLASLFDTVLGLFAIAIVAFTRRGNVETAQRIVSRITTDLDEATDTLSGIEDVRIENIARDLKLASSKLKVLVKEPGIGSPKSIEILESIQSVAFTLRDKADDLSLETDEAKKDALASLMEKRIEKLKKALEELMEVVT